MLKIVIICQNGATSDMIGQKMQEAANNHGVEATVSAFPYAKLDDEAIEGAAILVLAPQVRYKMREITSLYGDKLPITTIEPMDYGMLDGEKVITNILSVLNLE